MIIFRCSDIENVDYAIENHIWQVSFRPKKIKPDDMIALQVIKTKFIVVIGKSVGEPYLSKRREDWPKTGIKNEKDILWTIDIEPINLVGLWRYTEV